MMKPEYDDHDSTNSVVFELLKTESLAKQLTAEDVCSISKGTFVTRLRFKLIKN